VIAASLPADNARTPVRELLLGAAVLTTVFCWAYWPTLRELRLQWAYQPDYSHGYLVAPLAIWFAWWRRGSFPAGSIRPDWRGVILLAAALAVRSFAAIYRMVPADGWSIMLWVAGCVWLLGGLRLLRWAAPPIIFLSFMVPLPYRMERWLRLPLQKISTNISCFILNCLGEPAIAEGNTILLGPYRLEVEDACSGLRIFVGVLALAAALCIATRGTWWDKLFLLACTLPAALLANSLRVVATALLFQRSADELRHEFIHDTAGKLMIPMAACLLLAAAWYWRRLWPEVHAIGVSEYLNRQRV
jgi:exosortase